MNEAPAAGRTALAWPDDDPPSLYDVKQLLGHDPAVPSDVAAAAAPLAEWVAGFLTAGHPLLGRSGPVCPFVQPALDRLAVRLAVHRAGSLDKAGVQRLVDLHRRSFVAEAAAAAATEAIFHARLIVLHGLPAGAAARLVDAVQAELKPAFVADGLMLGQFHPDCPEPGLRNADFRPLQAPVPLLAIRAMIPTDQPFLESTDVFPAYFRRFADQVPSHLRARVAELAAAQGLTQLGEPTQSGLPAAWIPEALAQPVRAAVEDSPGGTVLVLQHAALPEPVGRPDDLARQIGWPTGRITKTLMVSQDRGEGRARLVLGADRRADLRAAAAALGWRRARLSTAEELDVAIGYPPGGVSPLGHSAVPVLIDVDVLSHPTVLIGGGRTGVEAMIEPKDLVRLTAGRVLTLAAPAKATT